VCLVKSSSSSSIWSQKSSLVDYGESDDSDTLIDNEDYDYEVNKSCSLVNEAIDEFENVFHEDDLENDIESPEMASNLIDLAENLVNDVNEDLKFCKTSLDKPKLIFQNHEFILEKQYKD
ncbi:unnamed protein product, partial [Brachionus calyciflorus]